MLPSRTMSGGEEEDKRRALRVQLGLFCVRLCGVCVAYPRPSGLLRLPYRLSSTVVARAALAHIRLTP